MIGYRRRFLVAWNPRVVCHPCDDVTSHWLKAKKKLNLNRSRDTPLDEGGYGVVWELPSVSADIKRYFRRSYHCCRQVLGCILPMKKPQCVIHFTVLFVNIELILLKNRKFCLLSALFVTRENLLPSSSSSGLFNSWWKRIQLTFSLEIPWKLFNWTQCP